MRNPYYTMVLLLLLSSAELSATRQAMGQDCDPVQNAGIGQFQLGPKQQEYSNDMHSLPQLYPKIQNERFALARSMLEQNQFSLSKKEFSLLISEAPDGNQSIAIAELATQIGDLDSAEAAYQKARVFPATSAHAELGLRDLQDMRRISCHHLDLAREFRHKGLNLNAIEQYQAALEYDRLNLIAQLELADALSKEARKDPALFADAKLHYLAYKALKATLKLKHEDVVVKRIKQLENRERQLAEKSLSKLN